MRLRLALPVLATLTVLVGCGESASPTLSTASPETSEVAPVDEGVDQDEPGAVDEGVDQDEPAAVDEAVDQDEPGAAELPLKVAGQFNVSDGSTGFEQVMEVGELQYATSAEVPVDLAEACQPYPVGETGAWAPLRMTLRYTEGKLPASVTIGDIMPTSLNLVPVLRKDGALECNGSTQVIQNLKMQPGEEAVVDGYVVGIAVLDNANPDRIPEERLSTVVFRPVPYFGTIFPGRAQSEGTGPQVKKCEDGGEYMVAFVAPEKSQVC